MNSKARIKEAFGKDILKELKPLKLQTRTLAFVVEYVTNGFNGTQAYYSARMGKKARSPECAAVIANGILNKVNVQQAIRLILDKWLAEKKLKLDRQIIHLLSQRAFYDTTIFYNLDGTLKYKTWEEIPEEWRCVVDSIERKYYGKDADREVIVIKLADREKAAEKLAKYITLYNDADIGMEHSLSKETTVKLQELFRGNKSQQEEKDE